jgi:RsiW-degrading membrane proteinase PrsW (M82 family)
VNCFVCGHLLADAARFCTTCGRAVQAEIGAPPPPSAMSFIVGAVPPTTTPVAPPDAAAGAPAGAVLLATLVPLRTWWEDGAWRRGRLGLFTLFAIAPFALLQSTAEDDDITRAAWGFALYFGLLWLLAMHAVIRPESQRRWLLARVVVFTAVAGVALAVAIERWVSPDNGGLLAMIFTVGLPEETVKALPVLLFVFLSKWAWTTRTYLFVGVLSGLTFGVVEAVIYSALYDSLSDVTGESTTTVSIWRLLSGGMFHACLTGITAYFIGLAHWYRKAALALMAIGLALTSVLHGLYNASSGNWLGTLVAAFIVFVFLGYVRSGDEIALGVGNSKVID